MRDIADIPCRENKNRHLLLNKFFSENCAVYKIMWGKKKFVGPDHRWQHNMALKRCTLHDG